MKKLLVICGLALMGASAVSAQSNGEFYKLGNRVGVSVGAGLTGVTIDAATCLTPYVGVRAGVDIFPNIKIGTELDVDAGEYGSEYERYTGETLPDQFDVEGKTSMTTGHILFDIHPFKTGFRLTAGAYFGGSKIISIYNKEDGALKSIYNFNNDPRYASQFENGRGIGLTLGDYFLAPDQDGNVAATLEVSGFRPYLGLGFGHAVPKKRVGVQFDLGVQFWGTPKVYLDGQDGKKRLTEEDTEGEDGGAIKVLSKITVYPCMTLRLTGRIL